MPREEVPMQGMREEEVILACAIIKVSIVDFGSE
jgi:hypothetical protein